MCKFIPACVDMAMLLSSDKPDKALVDFVKEWSKDYDYDVRKRVGLDKP